jgi:hypothetical protein
VHTYGSLHVSVHCAEQLPCLWVWIVEESTECFFSKWKLENVHIFET